MLNATIIKIHTEHAYVQNLLIKCSVSNELDKQLLREIRNGNLSSFYRNHIVLETDYHMFIGINDGKMMIGNIMSSLDDSKQIECNFRLSLKEL